jgi:Tfp pilus assembly protein PilZ
MQTFNQPHTGHWRIACLEPCVVSDGQTTREVVVWNVSTLGAYLVIKSPVPELGERLKLSFNLPNDPDPISVEARVAWRNLPWAPGIGKAAPSLPPGCGVQFVALDARDRARIEARVKATYAWVGRRQPNSSSLLIA